MQVDDGSPETEGVIRQMIVGLLSSTTSGATKAAPAVAVGAGATSFLPQGIDAVVSILSLIYVVIMIIYSLPKLWETFLYFKSRWGADDGLKVVQKDDKSVINKIKKKELGSDRK